jgi:D-alanine-D-alanine ligase
MGGCSRERPVSLASGRAVARALRCVGHTVRPADVQPGDVTHELLQGADVAFLALHGRWGEDGGIQAELEALGVCYTGSGPEASRLAMDKVAAKQRFFEEGIPTPALRVVPRGDLAMLDEAMDRLGPHLVVKPVADGSSIGVSMADTPASLRRAAKLVWKRGEPALVERRILGREFTVGILGEQVLPVIEIRTPGGWYDYRFKYKSSRTQYVFEHGLPAKVEARMMAVALAAHRALGCRDLSRVDLMLPEEGEPQVLEVNTIPGFTSHSLVPKAAARAGLSFGRLCEEIARLALRRAKCC